MGFKQELLKKIQMDRMTEKNYRHDRSFRQRAEGG